MAKGNKGGAGLHQSLFIEAERQRHPRLFIRRMLEEEALRAPWDDKSDQAQAWKKLKSWADLAEQGHLDQKETALDAEFLEKVFGGALGYRSVTEDPESYHRERNFTVPGAGTADGALGKFSSGQAQSPLAIIELKGAGTDLDHDKFNGRTPVQQLWDYLNQLPQCPWGILSNYVTIRLYHREAPQRAYEEFLVQEFRDRNRFCQFYYLFEREGLLGNLLRRSRALELLKRTQERQREVGPELYEDYSTQRLALIEHLVTEHRMTEGEAIRIAQKIIDRIVFVAFCEDRHLLPEKSIELAYSQLPRFYQVTNPRWQNFKALFGWLDQGNPEQDLPGYDGGLFANDPPVDGLELDDKWTHFFYRVGRYDFRDEVNVDVLGHLFEQSVTELEKLRIVGLFGKQAGGDGGPAMPKSAQRKRFGIYYTPPDFTRLIVDRTLGDLIRERVEPAGTPAERIAALRKITVCDPACGSGAFLIAAYDALEAVYFEWLRQMRAEGDEEAEQLLSDVPEWILKDNLHGVDLSQEAVEITQLALWLRSARKGRTLADLSRNIVCGNSLVSDLTAHPEAMDWRKTFPSVFPHRDAIRPPTGDRIRAPTVREGSPHKSRAAPIERRPLPDGRGSDQDCGFDVVIGNPPWERMKVQGREFFSLAAPEIASAVNAADRRKLIAKVEEARPELWTRYQTARIAAAKNLEYVRQSGEFPLTGRGDVNTYMVFAELARKIVARAGRVGLLVPSGIATDDTTKDFFGDLIEKQALVALYDFENRDKVFPDVDGRFKFCVLLMNGTGRKTSEADFVFFARRMDDVADTKRHIPLTAKDFKLLNPNTRTCPIFRSRRDAQLTKGIYRRVPILIDKSRKKGGNPWGVKFKTMFHQTNDAELFKTGDELKKAGYRLHGNRWVHSNPSRANPEPSRARKQAGSERRPTDARARNPLPDGRGSEHSGRGSDQDRRGSVPGRRSHAADVYLPLYEAKMIQAFDHRAASVRLEKDNWMRQGQPEDTSLVEHQNPEFVVLPRFWTAADNVAEFVKESGWLLSYKDVTSATNQRTMISAMTPAVGLLNSAPYIETGDAIGPRLQCCLLANLNSFVYDFIARQKVGGVHLNFFIVEQLPTLPPEAYAEKCPWSPRQTLEKWMSDRVLKLTCTAEDMAPLAETAGLAERIHRWNEQERALLRAELDAAYFILFGIERDDVEYILSTFQGVRDENEAQGGEGFTRMAILECFDRFKK